MLLGAGVVNRSRGEETAARLASNLRVTVAEDAKGQAARVVFNFWQIQIVGEPSRQTPSSELGCP